MIKSDIQIYYDNYHEKMNECPVMPTIRDVAELACVSVATVSRVINHSPYVSEKNRYSVQRAMEVLNYQPNANAQALAVQNTDTIGVVVTDVTDPFFAILVKSVDKVAEEHQKKACPCGQTFVSLMIRLCFIPLLPYESYSFYGPYSPCHAGLFLFLHAKGKPLGGLIIY